MVKYVFTTSLGRLEPASSGPLQHSKLPAFSPRLSLVRAPAGQSSVLSPPLPSGTTLDDSGTRAKLIMSTINECRRTLYLSGTHTVGRCARTRTKEASRPRMHLASPHSDVVQTSCRRSVARNPKDNRSVQALCDLADKPS